jgi:hypothetical protein
VIVYVPPTPVYLGGVKAPQAEGQEGLALVPQLIPKQKAWTPNTVTPGKLLPSIGLNSRQGPSVWGTSGGNSTVAVP